MPLLSPLVMGGCTGGKDAFLDGRIEDSCNQAWPVCSTVAGCLLGTQSYMSGRFPGTAQFIVQLAEPSSVSISVYLDGVTSTGTEASLTYYESGCQGRVPNKVTGTEFTKESDQVGFFTRSASLQDIGDHLVTFRSDAQAEYVLKVDVTPLRATNN